MIIQAANNRLYQRLCRAIDAPELIDDPRFSTSDLRRGHREEMTEELERRLVHRDRAEWQARFDEAGVPAGPILDVRQAFEDPQVRTLPVFWLVTRPDSSSTFRCSMAAGSDMGSGLASSLTVAGPWTRRSTMARRVGSARAAKVLSS